MTDMGQFDVIEPHIRPALASGGIFGAGDAFGCAVIAKDMIGGKMRFADDPSGVPRSRERSGKAFFTDFGIKVDPVIMYAVGARQQPGQDRSTRRLAHSTRGDDRFQTGAFAGQNIQMWRLDIAAAKAIAITALLVGCDEQDIWACHLRAAFGLRTEK